MFQRLRGIRERVCSKTNRKTILDYGPELVWAEWEMNEKGQSLYFKRTGIHWRVSSRHVARSDLYFLKMMLAAVLRRGGSQARGAGRLLEKSSEGDYSLRCRGADGYGQMPSGAVWEVTWDRIR